MNATDHELEFLTAFIGPNWDQHYRDSFAVIRARSGSFRHTWNWSAALTPMWLAYRGLLLPQLGCIVAFWLLSGLGLALWEVRGAYVYLPDEAPLLPFAFAYVALGAAQGATGDWLLFRRATRAVERAQAAGPDRATALAIARKTGRTSSGAVGLFVLLGALCAQLTLQRLLDFSHRRSHGNAYLGAMRSDLRNLVTAQEAYFADFATYTPLPQEPIRPRGDTGSASPLFTSSTGVTITMGTVTERGWNATASYAGKDRICGIFVGEAPPPVRGAREGEPRCQ